MSEITLDYGAQTKYRVAYVCENCFRLNGVDLKKGVPADKTRVDFCEHCRVEGMQHKLQGEIPLDAAGEPVA